MIVASLNSNDFLRVILYEDKSFNKETNCKILTASIIFIIKDTRFEKSLLMYTNHHCIITIDK